MFSENNYLLCKQNILDFFLRTRNDKERQLNKDVVMKMYRTISEKAGKNTPDNSWNLIRSHKIRAFFNNTLKGHGCDSFHVEFWMAYKLNPMKKSYFMGNTDGEKELYQKYVPYLTIQKEADISESPEYQKIKQENQILATETARHVVERKELQDLRTELERAKNGYYSLQVDLELAKTVKQHEIEDSVAKQLAEFRKELLGQSLERMKKT